VAIWGVSLADTTDAPPQAKTVSENTSSDQTSNTTFSVFGFVSGIADTSFSVENINISEYASEPSYTFDVSTLEKIETNEYIPLQFSDIKVGDKIIVQGILDNNTTIAHRIVSFTSVTTPLATTTATTTPIAATTTDIISTSTDEVASSSDDTASSTSTTTPSLIATSTATTTQ
jgi:hypothetical protein